MKNKKVLNFLENFFLQNLSWISVFIAISHINCNKDAKFNNNTPYVEIEKGHTKQSDNILNKIKELETEFETLRSNFESNSDLKDLVNQLITLKSNYSNYLTSDEKVEMRKKLLRIESGLKELIDKANKPKSLNSSLEKSDRKNSEKSGDKLPTSSSSLMNCIRNWSNWWLGLMGLNGPGISVPGRSNIRKDRGDNTIQDFINHELYFIQAIQDIIQSILVSSNIKLKENVDQAIQKFFKNYRKEINSLEEKTKQLQEVNALQSHLKLLLKKALSDSIEAIKDDIYNEEDRNALKEFIELTSSNEKIRDMICEKFESKDEKITWEEITWEELIRCLNFQQSINLLSFSCKLCVKS